MPRVLHIIPTLERGGAEKQLALLASGLKQREWDVHVACLTRGGPLQEPLEAAGVPVTVIGNPWKIDPTAFLRLKRYISELKPDLVHTWLFAANSYGRAAALACGVKHIVGGERCVDPWKGLHHLLIDRWLAGRSERIVTNSNGVVDFYTSQGLPRQKFTVIPNGIGRSDSVAEAASFGAASSEAGSFRHALLAELGLPANAKLIGAVGRLSPQKRYKDLIWAMDLLRCIYDDLYLIVMGDGPQRWRLERFANQVTEGESVRFLGERGDVHRILPHLMCLWQASAYEGQSNSVMEAMSAGLPVIASDIPGHRDLVVHGETGFLVTLGDRAGFATQTRELIKHPELGPQLGAAGQARIEREFSVEKMVERYEDLYHELFASDPPRDISKGERSRSFSGAGRPQ